MRRLIISLAAASLIGCGEKNRATIEGQFYGAGGHKIYLEELFPVGSKVIDSTVASSKGTFSFKVNLASENPSFYNVRMDGQFVPLLVEAGESVDINAVGNIYYNYSVEGSKGSQKVRELNRQTLSISQKLDSLIKLYETITEPEEVQRIGREYGQTYVQLKRDAISFVLNNANSLASIVPLYQPIYGTKFLFDEPQDIIYFRVVADSLEKYYPTSPYVLSLRRDVKKVDDVYTTDSLISSNLVNTVDYPEIEMKDQLGVTRKLSDLKGKVILLDFTATNVSELKIITREMVDVYNKYAAQGFEIFQVSLDTSKADWLNSLAQSRLPWITVSDQKGADSPSVKIYNVQKLPTNFLISQSGEIVGRNLHGAKLDQEVAKLMK